MNLKDKILYSRPIQRYLWKHGYILKNDLVKNELLKPLKPADYELINSSISKLQDTRMYTDPVKVIKEVNTLNNNINRIYSELPEKVQTKSISYLNNIGAVGYEAAGSVLKRQFPYPFQPYAFLADNYWAADKARGEIRIEIARDGYVLTSNERTAKKRIKAVNDILNELGIPRFWIDWCDHLNTFGNFWNIVNTNKLGGMKPNGIEMLIPERVVPVLDAWQETIIAWDYEVKGRTVRFPLDSIDHVKTYSTRTFQLGSPALTSMIVEIEADMQATIFNNTVMQKGGLIKGVLSLSQPDNMDVINDQTYLDYANKLQELINKKFSGIRGGGQLLAMYGIDNYFDLNKIGEIDGIYQKSSDRTAARTAMLLGCPAERLGIRNYSQYQNSALITDTVALAMDNRTYYLTSLVADYINTKILKERLGIEDVQIQASGEFGSVSVSAASFGKTISEMNSKIMTVNEFRMKVLHWEPLADHQLGETYIGEITDPQTLSSAIGPAATKSFSAVGIQIIKHKPNEINHY